MERGRGGRRTGRCLPMATKYQRRFGDRKEGRLLRSLDAFTKFTPFIMKSRNDASNQFTD